MPYLCYLLQSLGETSQTYIGYTATDNVFRRLAQHNGEERRGARRTRTHRPWRIVLTVGPFTRTAALAFEYQWSHYGNVQNLRPQRRHVQRQLDVLGHVLQQEAFLHLDLTLAYADAEVQAMFEITTFGHLYGPYILE